MKIPRLRVIQYFTDEVHWVLDLEIGIGLPSSNDNGCTDHVTCSRYVKLQVLMGF
jgi:hypothetical protein